MEETLEELKSSLEDLDNKIVETLNERQSYLNVADDIRIVYNRLKEDKDTMRTYRKNVNLFCDKEYGTFKGNNYKTIYRPQLEALTDSYDIVIEQIDINLDELNKAILSYENKASDCFGIFGTLEKAYNTVKTKIENWIN